MKMAIPRNILVVTGAGGMGLATCRRLGSGRHILLGDYSSDILNPATESLARDGHSVELHKLDVSDMASVEKFAAIAGKAGHIDAIVHTAGVSPLGKSHPLHSSSIVQNLLTEPSTGQTSQRVFEINLLGTANVIKAFLPYATLGTSAVCVSSLAGRGE